MKIPTLLVAALLFLFSFASADPIFIRINQLGYSTNGTKNAIAFSKSPFYPSYSSNPSPPLPFLLTTDKGDVIFRGSINAIANATWGQFPYHAELDFSPVHSTGTFVLRIGSAQSLPVKITQSPYSGMAANLLPFMHEQRCGFNPWLDVHCHEDDGRTAYGPRPYGTQIDVTGGWHDAGDMLKYLMTSEQSAAEMLLAYQLKPDPNILTEVRWGLDWMLKMHPSTTELYHQVGDDRDHAGWRLPQNDQVDYGWGKGQARVAYFADGGPQGLRKYKSQSNGVANLAGVYAATMGLAYEIWKDDPKQKDFADHCLKAGEEVYELGRKKEGVQQGNSYSSPYRYAPTNWAGDMEWGAAELFRATGKKHYLKEAKHYAEKSFHDQSWMGKEQTGHYQYFPFVNLGHYRLYDLVDPAFQTKLLANYAQGIEACRAAASKNPYRVGVPFIWCSNNLVTALATQCLLVERVSGSNTFHNFAMKQCDWLLGRNPWGTSMFTGIGDQFPRDAHLMTVQLLHRPVRGGLVDGPVYNRIFTSLQGVSIRQPDPLAPFQGLAVYHDDGRDYSTNEPTLDGTASAILLFTLCDTGSN